MRGTVFAIFAVWAGVLAGYVASTARGQTWATPEVRGTWVTTTGMTNPASPIFSPASTTTSFRTLRDIGFNSLYVDVFRNGDTYFDSPTHAAITGNLKAPLLGSRDLLQEMVIQGHRNRMAVIGWFQYGFAAKFGNPGTNPNELARYMADRGWLLRDQAGNFTNSSNGFSWMNPLVPEVREYLKGIVVDAVTRYDLDGIQFDDRLAWPIQFGWDDYTRQRYLAETGRALPTSVTNTLFKQWRAQKVTEFARELIDAVRAVRPNLIISVSPATYPFSYDNYCADWPAWRAAGLFDEFVPQVYRQGFSNFDRDWDGAGSITTGGQVQYMGDRRGDFAAGIAVDVNSTFNTWNDLRQMIDLVRQTPGVAGHVLWYTQGVFEYASQLTAYYDVAGRGHAPRPDLPPEWRPPPVVGSALGGGVWELVVPATGFYDLIAGSNDVWRVEQAGLLLQPGVVRFTVPGAQQVELLFSGRVLVIPEPGGVAVLAAAALGLGRRRARPVAA
ncbi:MAG: glycoside hydrolase family 10 protein [Tepidisphaerales bacterium]